MTTLYFFTHFVPQRYEFLIGTRLEAAAISDFTISSNV
jgi:hypothetical protein